MTISNQAPRALAARQSLSAPAINHNSWRFGDLAAAQLLPLLQRYLLAQNAAINWQLIWLNNDGCPVIGLLPKVSWQVFFNTAGASTASYQVLKTQRPNTLTTRTDMSYSEWQNELIAYSQTYNNSTDFAAKNTGYHHGLMGFIGYDIAAQALSPNTDIAIAEQPCAVLGHYDIYLTPVTVNNNDNNPQNLWQLTIKDTHFSNKLDNTEPEITQLIDCLNRLDKELSGNDKTKISLQPLPLAPLLLTAKWHKKDYQRAFMQTQNYLQQGDCYQINLTQVWQAQFKYVPNQPTVMPLIAYLPALHANTQAPFAGYMSTYWLDNKKSDAHLAHSFELLSCSPELFFTFIADKPTGAHHIRTKPIKGTQPRGQDAKQDANLKQQLMDSAKDRSENLMIVDLLRNDLGKYAETGSVKVPQLFEIESFSNVHHMVSTITAKLKPDAHPLAVLFGSLPAGSITGTPKKRAVEIISELEQTARGAYCGTLGYMNFEGSGQWNVLIRSLQANHLANGDKHISLWAGGGITIASSCADEYQECLDKVGNLLAVLKQPAGSQIGLIVK